MQRQTASQIRVDKRRAQSTRKAAGESSWDFCRFVLFAMDFGEAIVSDERGVAVKTDTNNGLQVGVHNGPLEDRRGKAATTATRARESPNALMASPTLPRPCRTRAGGLFPGPRS